MIPGSWRDLSKPTLQREWLIGSNLKTCVPSVSSPPVTETDWY